MAKVLKEKIISMEEIVPDIYKMTVMSDYISINAVPGQFVNVKCSDGITPLLRRPISICDVDRNNKTFDIVFQIRGTGTEYLSKKQINDELDIIGPLGKGFEISKEHGEIAVVGGGIGIFPLLFLLKEKPGAVKTAFLGFRNKESIALQKNFSEVCSKLNIATDDGSEGYHGFVTDLLRQELSNKVYDIVYTCGPEMMMKKVARAAEEKNIKCQVSLEQRMGCGIGACLVCACKTKLGDEWEYSHVCKDGPVFWSNEVIFE